VLRAALSAPAAVAAHLERSANKHMKSLLIVFAFLSLGMVLAVLATERKVAAARAKGVYPSKGNESQSDVIRLVRAGEKTLAIRCYRTLHKVGLKEAKDAIERL